MININNIVKNNLTSTSKKMYLCPNNTCHASHMNSAPRQVFAFYKVYISSQVYTYEV